MQTANGTNISIDVRSGCSQNPTPVYDMLGENPPLPVTDMNPVWQSCSQTGDVPKGIIEFQGEDCNLIFDLSDNESDRYAEIDMTDVQIVTT